MAIKSNDPDCVPSKTNTLERVMNRGVTQVLFTGRKTVTTLDLYLSIATEGNTNAHYYLLKYGVVKGNFIDFWQRHYKGDDYSVISAEQADEVLEEFTTNLTQMARDDALEPVIGRVREIDDIINVLAKRFKANVLMVGDPGVGKTAIAEGMAFNIVQGNVPEFLKERSALEDFLDCDLLAIGSYNTIHARKIAEVYKNIPKHVEYLTPREAEILKIYNNSYAALRVVFANIMYEVCEKHDADYDIIKTAYEKTGKTTGNFNYDDCWMG